MKAIIFEEYGLPEVLKLVEVEKPTPKKNDVLIRVHATTVRTGDLRMRKADPPTARVFNGLRKPKRVNVLGMELAGVVDAVGGQVTRFKAGDEVFAAMGLRFGAHAEYALLSEDAAVVKKPANLSFAEAAAIPSSAIAAWALLGGRIKPGDSVLVNGAAGNVGTFALQVAKDAGAEVTAVCSSSNFDLARKLGASQVIDYSKTDFTAGETKFDLVFDAVGKMISGITRNDVQKVLKPQGKFISIEDSYKESKENLEVVRGLIEAGRLVPVIDRTYTFEEIPDAHHYVERGHKHGNVVITIGNMYRPIDIINQGLHS